MAARGWGGSIATAIGAAAGAGAAQLGLGYGLGIIRWLPSSAGVGESAWVAGLAWALWIAATSTIAGAICAERLATPLPSGVGADRRYSPASATVVLHRIAVAVAAAIGALVIVALIAVPARAATRADTFSPQTIAAGYAVVGVLLGLTVAIWALSSSAVARNVIATGCWMWLLAVVAVVNGVLSGRGLTTAPLGIWQITNESDRFWFRDFYWPGAVLWLGSAAVIGALAARPAARHSQSRVGAAISGGVGPLLVGAAYFLAAPRLSGVRAEQLSAHVLAPYAVVAGVLGSVIVAALAQRADSAPDRPGPRADARDAGEPSGAIWRPVPQGGSEGRPAQPAGGGGDPATGRASVPPGPA